jgi:hypothetical protein
VPICPFCRRSVTNTFTIWCECGVNLIKYPRLPNSSEEVRKWLKEYSPASLEARIEPGQLIDQAKTMLIKGQDSQINQDTRQTQAIAQARSLLSDFLQSCAQANIPPNTDVGALRKDRWKAQKKAGLKSNLPLREFKPTAAYFFQVLIADYQEQFYLCTDGSLYRHIASVPDPYPIEKLVEIIPVVKLAEGLRDTLVELLKQKQQPQETKKKKKKSK